MPTRPPFLATPLRPLVASLLLASAPVPAARAAAAPAVPTFFTAWGSTGSSPGQLKVPFFLAVDGQGHVYVADSQNNRVQEFDRLGNLLRLYGSYGSGNGQFSAAEGIATDAAGNVYVGDWYNNRVQKFDPNGNYLLQWGGAGTGPGQFNGPEGIAVDAAGNVYVGDYNNARIEKFTSTGASLAQWGSAGSGPGQLNAPEGIAIDDAGDVLVADYGNNRVQRFTAAGAYVGQFGSAGSGNGQFSGPAGIGVDALGNIFVAEENNARVQKFDRTGTYLAQWGSAGGGNGQFNKLFGLAVDGAGNVYTSEYFGNRVQEFSGAGAAMSQAPPQWVATLNSTPTMPSCTGAGVSTTGTACVLDYTAGKVVTFGPAGWLSTWGTAGTNPGQLNQPYIIAMGPGDAPHVFDAYQTTLRVQRFTTAGAYLSGWTTTYGTGPGQLQNPAAMAVDAAGNVYLLDRGMNTPYVVAPRVEKFTSAGSFVMQWTLNSGANSIAVDGNGYVYVANNSDANVYKYDSGGNLVGQWNSAGAFGSLMSTQTIAVSPVGTVYVTDGNTNQFMVFAAPARIEMISDVAGDQGHKVHVRFRRSSADDASSVTPVLGYDVYLRSDATAAAVPVAHVAARPAAPAYLTPASTATEYAVDVSTAIDATRTADWYSAFFVRAWIGPYSSIDSDVEYGRSVDNIPPPAPTPFTAAYASGATYLHWGASTAPDFATFRLYRGASSGFTPGAGNLVSASADTGYVDVGPAGSWYKVSAVDLDGNEGGWSVLGPGRTSSVAPGEPLAFALEGMRPNPASSRSLVVRFTLPTATPARIELLDVAGRAVVTRVVGGMGAGVHALDLARDGRVAPGLYFVRLEQGTRRATARTTVLE